MENSLIEYEFNELFQPLEKGIHGLTEEQIYNSFEKKTKLVPIWGGNADHSEIAQLISSEAINNKGKKNKII